MNKKLEKFKTPLKIGSFEMPTRILSAPMAGITSRSYRDFLRLLGCKFSFTEMVNAEGLIRNEKKSKPHIGIDGEQKPYGIQIYGNSAESLAKAAAMVEGYGAAIVDLNLGCPARKVVRNKSGSALLQEPDKLKIIFSLIRRAVKIPFTIKMRSGIGENKKAAFEIAEIAEGEGIDAICLHPRTREDFYSGSADWTQIAEMKTKVKIPVIGNGDIKNPLNAVQMVEQTNCDAVMIGRAAMGNPWIFKHCSMVLEENIELENLPKITINYIIDCVKKQYHFLMSEKSELSAIREMRKFVIQYFKGFPGAREFRQRWMTAEFFKDIESLFNEIKEINLNLILNK